MISRQSSLTLTSVVAMLFMLLVGLFLGSISNIYYWVWTVIFIILILPVVQFIRKEEMSAFCYLSASLQQKKLRLLMLIANVGLLIFYIYLLLYMFAQGWVGTR